MVRVEVAEHDDVTAFVDEAANQRREHRDFAAAEPPVARVEVDHDDVEPGGARVEVAVVHAGEVALDDVSEKNGCLFFMPGSHNDAELGRTAGGFGNINSIFQESDYPEWSEREMVPMVLNAGDATFREQRKIAFVYLLRSAVSALAQTPA